MEIFYREKAIHAGKKIQEKWLYPLRKIGKFSWYATAPLDPVEQCQWPAWQLMLWGWLRPTGDWSTDIVVQYLT